MPLPALVLPALAAGVNLLQTGISAHQSNLNRKFVQQTNDKQAAYNYRMYLQQRFDSLMDWNRENRYNSPEQQMQRLKEAGLNPHLVYGNGATATSGPVHEAGFNAPNFQPPQNTFDPSTIGPIGEFMDTALKQITTDNTKKQGDLISAEIANKTIDTANKATEGERGKFELGKAKELKDLVIQEQLLRNDNMKANTEYLKQKPEFTERQLNQKDVELAIKQNLYRLQKAKTTADIAKVHEDILRSIVYRETNPIIRKKLLTDIENGLYEKDLKRVEIDLRSQGLNPGSPEYVKRWTSVVSSILFGAFSK